MDVKIREINENDIKLVNDYKILIRPEGIQGKFNKEKFKEELKKLLSEEEIGEEIGEEIIGREDVQGLLQILFRKKKTEKGTQWYWYPGWGIIIGTRKRFEKENNNVKVVDDEKGEKGVFIVWGIIPSTFEIGSQPEDSKVEDYCETVKIFKNIEDEPLFKSELIEDDEEKIKIIKEEIGNNNFHSLIDLLKEKKEIFNKIKEDLNKLEEKYDKLLAKHEEKVKQKNDFKIHIFKIAWSENKWKGMPAKKEDYEKSYEMAKSYEWVKENGIGIEWWNFYEDFDKENFYFTDPQVQGVKKIENGDIVLLISRKGEENRQFVGVMGECIKFSEPKKVFIKLNEEQINWIKEKNPKFPKKDLSITYIIGSKKDLSFCLDKLIPYEGYKELGNLRQSNYTQIKKEHYEKVIKMLEEAKRENPHLQEKIEKVINKIRQISPGEEKSSISSNKSLSSILNALQTKPFLILAGISGTGKTQIARLIAWAMSGEEKNEKKEDKDDETN